jgi:hypothetical protein
MSSPSISAESTEIPKTKSALLEKYQSQPNDEVKGKKELMKQMLIQL